MDIIKKNRIAELPKHVADKIAAGEVVDRPLSIIKELVENAIDAGATSVIIEIKNGGKTYIRITDNGSGIEKDDVALAFKRHATSKVQNASDLDRITTLGFRGEALASIAAVSRTELITKTPDAKIGVSLKLEGGEIVEKNDIGCPEGTTVIIEDLFFNTPARMKFMKTDATESTLIIDFVSKMALAYPDIKMRLINNGNILFSTPGKGDIYANILTIYSKEIGDKLIHVQEGEGELSLEAYVSPPSYTKTNRRHQIFFVNGRYINSKVMEKAISEAYKEKLFEGRYPVAFLFLKIDPERLDVNIHPNKKEVRFEDERAILEFLVRAIRKNLNTKDAIAEIKQENIFKMNRPPVDKPVNSMPPAGKIEKMPLETRLTETRDPVAEPARINITDMGTTGIQQVAEKVVAEEQVDIKKLLFEERQAENTKVLEKPEVYQTAQEEQRGIDRVFEEMEIMGTLFGTYIAGIHEDVFYLIDQHAAHERIFYEQLLAQYEGEEKLQQPILLPFVVNVTYAVKNDVQDWLDFLGNMGYIIEEFGPKAFIIKGIPMFMELEEAQSLIDYFMDNIAQGKDLKDQKKLDKIITNACKKAVKAHDVLDIKEIHQLMKDLGKAKNPYHCPHGRPTLIKMSKYEVEKMFKRV